MHKVSTFLPTALASVIQKAPLTPEKVTFAWRTAAGPAVARNGSVRLEGKILHVQVPNEAWRREVERSAAIIRTRMDHLLGQGVVRGLEVTIA